MPAGVRIDPYLGFRFRVEIEGIVTAAFSEATVPDITIQTADYREGTDAKHVRKLSGMNQFGSITLKKGLTDSRDLSEWQRLCSERGAGGNRRNVSLILIDDNGGDKARWEIVDAWPTKISTTGFNATSGNSVMVETLELANEGIRRIA
jgi:phage tail-like protein